MVLSEENIFTDKEYWEGNIDADILAVIKTIINHEN